MQIFNNYDSDLRFKQINSNQPVQNKLVGCSASLQPECYTINILENHFYNN